MHRTRSAGTGTEPHVLSSTPNQHILIFCTPWILTEICDVFLEMFYMGISFTIKLLHINNSLVSISLSVIHGLVIHLKISCYFF
jgi:hypothetical protein